MEQRGWIMVLLLAFGHGVESGDPCANHSCVACIASGCFFCANDFDWGCVVQQTKCPNGSSIIIPPYISPEFCPQLTTTTTPTPPPAASTQSPFYFYFFLIVVIIISGVLLIGFLTWVYYKKMDPRQDADHSALVEERPETPENRSEVISPNVSENHEHGNEEFEDDEHDDNEHDDDQNLSRLSNAIDIGRVTCERGGGYYADHAGDSEGASPSGVRRGGFLESTPTTTRDPRGTRIAFGGMLDWSHVDLTPL